MKIRSFTSGKRGMTIVCYAMIFTCTGLLIGVQGTAQSIVGKWKEVSGKNYFNAKGVAKTGKQFVPAAPQMGGQVLDIRADHSFSSSELMNWVPSQMDLTGTWKLTGDQLNTILNANQPDPTTNPTKEAMINNYTVTWSGNNLILSLIIKANPIMDKMEKTYIKM
jgi:hypothetical protein